MFLASITLLPNPLKKANIISKLFFWWTKDLFFKGYRKDLDFTDLYEICNDDRAEILGEQLKKILNDKSQPNLRIGLFRMFRRSLLTLMCMSVTSFLVLRSLEPLFLGKFLKYFRENSQERFEDAALYAGLILAINFCNFVLITSINMRMKHIGMQMRTAICNLIYCKILRISQTSLNQTHIGNLVNFLSNDLSRCDTVSWCLALVVDLPLVLILVTTILWFLYRWAGVIGLCELYVVIILEVISMKLYKYLRVKWAFYSDKRIQILSEVLQGIHIIKTRVLESRFGKIIDDLRILELKYIKYSQQMRGVKLTLRLINVHFAIFLIMVTVTIFYESSELRPEKIFLITGLLHTIADIAAFLFSLSVGYIAEFSVALNRFEEILNLDEIDTSLDISNKSSFITKYSKTVAVLLDSCTARWNQNIIDVPQSQQKVKNTDQLLSTWLPPTLRNISLEIISGSLTAIIGPAGCGKTSLLHLLMREMYLGSGTLECNGRLSYASQNPWIFPGTVRENILFYEDFDEIRYNFVLNACNLKKDLQQFPNGDNSFVGERGVRLSGGQKSRISLARTIYRKAEIYLLDNPLNSVDSEVANHIFDHCLGSHGQLAIEGATRIMTTHHLQFSKKADRVVMMSDGGVIKQGTPGKIFGVNECQKNSTGIVINENNFKSNEVLVQTRDMLESSSKGAVKGLLGISFLKIGKKSELFLLFLTLILSQILASSCSLWVSFWLKQESQRRYNSDKYFQNSTTILGSIVINFPLPTQICICIQFGLLFALILISNFSFNYYFIITKNISLKLHKKLYDAVISTQIKFFTNNSSGRILNRFSKDMGIIDDEMPRNLIYFLQIFFSGLGAFGVTAIVAPIIFIPIFILIAILYHLSKIYLRTSLNLRRLEGIARSPIYTQISETLDGLTIIRLFKKQKNLISDFNSLQNVHSACWFLGIGIECAYSIILGFLGFLILFLALNYFLFFDTGRSGSTVGLTISQLMITSSIIIFGNKELAAYLTNLISLERVFEYCNLLPEDCSKTAKNLPEIWPIEGSIEFQNVNYRYDPTADPVLKNLNFFIKPGEKIGIVGRTGAGKSSLISSIYRLAMIEGNIIIDNLDTKYLQLKEMRSRILFIPKDPILFFGTIRTNLDPLNEHTDDMLWLSLSTVGLRTFVSSCGGLSTTIDFSSNNWTASQKQLLYMANALLKKFKIIILDEVTSYMDYHTDNLVCEVIKVNFSTCTVLTVAHRLHNIIAYDRILVLENGEIVEFDTPIKLIQNSNGVFRKMVDMLDIDEAEKLKKNIISNNQILSKNNMQIMH